MAIRSLTQEIEHLTQLRTKLIDLAGSSDDADLTSPSAVGKKRSAKKSAVAKQAGRSPVSQETRQKMAEAHRAFFVRKKTAAKKVAPKKAVVKNVANKSTAKTSAAKRIPVANFYPRSKLSSAKNSLLFRRALLHRPEAALHNLYPIGSSKTLTTSHLTRLILVGHKRVPA